jgi:uncharacterized membrane protein
MRARQDFLWAAAAGVAALAVYVRTLAPGLVGASDTPMFQFIGRVLGVAHNPGYPLYVLLTYPFSFLPVGSLPYRINLFSALLGAVTVSLTCVIARRLGCRTTVSLAAALGLAFGQVFWSQAVIAEVYTLHAAIIAGMLLAILAWARTGQPRFFFTGVALFAAGLGHHTTIVGFVPGLAVFVLLTNRQFVMRPRTLVTTAAILGAGLLQYGFIILRSRQPGAYVESRATTVADLVDVMAAAQFKERLFAFRWQDVVFERLPSLFEHVLAPELTLVGLALALVGGAWLLRRRLAQALLLLLGGGAILGFAANYAVVDTPVFLIPTILVLWLLAAVAAEQAIGIAGRWPWAALALGVATLSLPAWNLTHNFATTDRSRDTTSAVVLDAVFRVLPDRTALVHEDFLVDRMVMFKLLGDRAAAGRRIELVDRHADAVQRRRADGASVFAFGKAARRLRYDALNFAFAPLPLTGGLLTEVLSRLTDGTIVALAVPAGHARRFAATGASLADIGGPLDLARSGLSNVATVGVRGAHRGAILRIDPSDIQIGVDAGHLIGDTGVVAPEAIEVQSTAAEAAIRQGARDIVRTVAGAAVAIWRADGTLQEAFVLQADDHFRVPLLAGPLSLYPLRGTWSSQEIRTEWGDAMSAFRTGSAMARVRAGQTAVLYVGDGARLAPRVIDRSSERVKTRVTRLDGSTGDTGRARLEAEQVKSTGLREDAHVYRIEMTASGTRPASVLLALGGVPAHAVGRVISSHASRTAELFSVDTEGLLRTPDRISEVLLMARDDQAQLTGDGWSSVDWDDFSAYRWMTSTEAQFLLPIARGPASRIRLQALLGEHAVPTMISLRLNRVECPPQPLHTGWHAYEWIVPAGALSSGTNEVAVIVDRLVAPQGAGVASKEIAITEVRVIH